MRVFIIVSSLRSHYHNQYDKDFIRFQVSFEDLRHHMGSSYENIRIVEVIFTAKVKLSKRELTEI